MNRACGLLVAVCALVVTAYACMTRSGVLELSSPNAADSYYNLLVQGFRAGQLNLKKEVPPGLARLPDPYDPTANIVYWASPYRLLDLSYYKGKFYLYWGITPALILFWPYAAVTGHYLFHRQAVIIFCSLGFLTSVGLLCALWRRYFLEVSVGVVVAGALALGLATGLPVLLAQSDVYEVAISCGYMLTMLSLAAVWCALHQPERKSWWLAAASLAYGLAVGARPTMLCGAVILLVPVAQAWRERRKIGTLLLAATGPILLIVSGLLLYNFRRFDNPFEFGVHYQLTWERQFARRFFSPRFLWFNFRVYFLEPVRWSTRFPFVHDTPMPPRPAGYTQVTRPFGVLTTIPLVWLALATPLTWWNRPVQARSVLRWFVVAAALLFGMCALTLALFCASNFRYEADFLPALLLLAVAGILGIERALASTSESGQPDRPAWRWAARLGYGLMLAFSVAFSLLASAEYYAEAHSNLGTELFQAGKIPEAIQQYQRALRINPDYAEAHKKLGVALVRLGRLPEAITQYEQTLRISPDDAEAHDNLGATLGQAGRVPEAIAQFEAALRIKPADSETHCNLGIALGQVGRMPEAMDHWNEALRHRPDYAEAHYCLAGALNQAGKTDEAIAHYEQALRIRPDYIEAHYNLAVVLERAGRPQDAITQYRQALRINPNFIPVQTALARLLEEKKP